ncbi:MAG: 50S ribosomal protein L17 [Candidatus Omnitrophica bacterium]|nr:50S ribosomal protein L17 [Candidatus Omnitrophota bacterium]
MRHQKKRSHLNRFTSWRKATLVSMSRNLLIYQSVKTTKVKAKAARPVLEKLISWGKENNLQSRRKAFSVLQDNKLVKLLFSEIAPLFAKRQGGYCRILPMGFRRGDGASRVIMELTEKRAVKRKPLKKKEAPGKPNAELTKTESEPATKPPEEKKSKQKFLGGLRKIFRKDKDAK